MTTADVVVGETVSASPQTFVDAEPARPTPGLPVDAKTAWRMAIGPNWDYWEPQIFGEVDFKKNIAAFFFPMLWFPYRKLWGWTLAVFTYLVVSYVLFSIWAGYVVESGDDEGVAAFVSVVLMVELFARLIFSSAAHEAVFKRLSPDVDALVKHPRPDNDDLRTLQKRGGVSYVALTIALLLILGPFVLVLLVLAGLA